MSGLVSSLSSQLKIATAQKQQQIERLQNVREDLSLLSRNLNLSTQTAQGKLSKAIAPLQHDLNPKPEDPLEQLSWLLEVAKKIQQGHFNIQNHIHQLRETAASTEELAITFEARILELDKDIDDARKLVDERKKTLALIQQLNLELIKKNQERQQ